MRTSKARRRAALLAVSSGALLGALAAGGAAQAGASLSGASNPPGPYTFHTLDNQRDTTFNQLLGINQHGVIAGYFGSGAAGHPNQGYTLAGHTYHNENFPGSVQTQVTGLNDRGVTVGFWSDMNNANQVNDNFGFWAQNGHFHTVNFPTKANATPPVNQLLGVNDHDVAVGFYTDPNGNNHGYSYDIGHGQFRTISVAASPSVTATAINNRGDVAGFFTNASGATVGFLRDGGKITDLAFPGASMTQPLGVNDADEVVGVYQVGSGDGAATHGFTWTPQHGFITVDDPNGIGTTTVNGVNDAGDLVGFYTDAANNVDGMLAVPTRTTSQTTLAPQPVGTVSLAQTSSGTVRADLDITGLAPGVAHAVDIQSGSCDALGPAVVNFSPVTADASGRAVASLTSAGSLPRLSQAALMIHLGANVTDPTENLPVACVNLTGWHGSSTNRSVMPLSDQSGPAHGGAVLHYDGATETLTAHVVVSGLAPYSQHAAHLHAGSCATQGPVVLGLPDLVANRWGVADQTATISGVTSAPPASGWYLNVHLGAMSQILGASGQPTVLFQPLACGNVTTH